MKHTLNKKSLLTILIVAAIFVGIGTAVIISTIRGRIPDNPPGTIGNTAGNLNNSGFFCESDGKVYFANAYDGGALYSMDVNEMNLKKLNGSVTRNILAAGDYVYYFQTGSSGKNGASAVRVPASFNRCRKNGKNIKSLGRSVVVTGQLSGSYLYLLEAGDPNPTVRKIKIDGSDEKILANYIINPACAVGNIIYYNGTQNNHFLYALNTTNDVPSEVFEANLWYPVADGGYIYYMDVENHYRLCRYSLSSNTVEILTEDRVDLFNVGNGYIYYQTVGSNPQLKCMYADGSNPFVLAEGVYTNINMTSQFVYFQEYNDTNSVYHSRIGSMNFDSFYNAYLAALENAD